MDKPVEIMIPQVLNFKQIGVYRLPSRHSLMKKNLACLPTEKNFVAVYKSSLFFLVEYNNIFKKSIFPRKKLSNLFNEIKFMS